MSFRDDKIIKPVWPYALNHLSPQAQGLVGWYPLHLPGGEKIFNLAGGGNPGTLKNGVIWTAMKNGAPALQFDGSNGYVEVPASHYDGSLTTNYTLACWMWLNTTTGLQRFISHGRQSSNNGTGWGANGTNFRATHFAVVDMDTTGDHLSGKTNQWLHCAFYHSAGTGRFFLNGIQIASVSGSAATANTDDPLCFGARIDTGGGLVDLLTGKLADLRIYNRALSDAEAYALYDPQTRYDLYWKLGRRVTFIPTAGDQTISPPLITNTPTLHAPTVAPGAVTITPLPLANAPTLHTPTLTTGPVTISPPLLQVTPTLFAPTVTGGAVVEAQALLTLTVSLETTLTLSISVAGMANKAIDIGDLVLVDAEFKNEAGAFVDPTGVKFIVQNPSGAETEYIYLMASEVTRPAQGKFRLKYQPLVNGRFEARCEGTGAVIAAERTQFFVRQRFAS